MDCNFAQKSNDLELSNTQKIKLRNWVSKNPNWKSIDDLPNDLFIDLVDKAGDNTDKRVAIQMKAIKFMKTLKTKRCFLCGSTKDKKTFSYDPNNPQCKRCGN